MYPSLVLFNFLVSFFLTLSMLQISFRLFLGNNPSLPESVSLVLQLIKMEHFLHEKADECKALNEKIADQNAEMEKSKKERELEVTKLKKDVKVMQEKLDIKTKEFDEKNGKREDKHSFHGKNGVSKLTDELKEELKKVKEEKDKVLSVSTRCFSFMRLMVFA